ncbi:MAG: hypothetical protein H6993_15065 [Pseudomonadales bacterium]|nr:hypothetical protein [Pseudomonadales bacterium]MCP5185284.1 hypothetical protein [Pseudomonadales bacterium]
MIAVDASFLLAAVTSGGDLAGDNEALRLLNELRSGDSPWAIPLFALVDFLRQASTGTAGRPAMASADALAFVHELVNTPQCSLLMPGDDWHESLARLRASAPNDGGQEDTDVRVVALCTEHGVVELLSSDSAMQRFSEPRIHVVG